MKQKVKRRSKRRMPRFGKRKPVSRTKYKKSKFLKNEEEEKGSSMLRQSGAGTAMATLYNAPLSRMHKAHHRYQETLITLNPTVGGIPDYYTFSANGMYDPNITGVGHQPIGFDQMTDLYDHFTVIGSKITVWFDNEDGTNGNFGGVYISDQSPGSVDSVEVVESSKGTFGYMQADNGKDTTLTLNSSINIGRFLGRPNPLSEDDLRGSVTANPAEQAYWVIWAGPNSSTDSGAVAIKMVLIEYIAIWTEPKIINRS